VAQARRRRQTKHRGNAAGVVVARGRTGRKPTDTEKSESARKSAEAKQRRVERMDQPPTWRGALGKAAVAALIVFVASLFLIKASVAQALEFFPFVLLIYVPLSYYTDLFMYRRRQARKQRQQDRAGR
jgi:hypothetical protein